jgi:hypothetical protein
MFQPFSAIIMEVQNKEKETHDIGYLWHGCAIAQLKKKQILKLYKNY